MLSMRVLLLCACVAEVGCAPTDKSQPAATSTATVPAVSPCAPGDLPDGDACLPPGIDQCGHGFEADGQRGCVAILPAEPCANGTFAVPGEIRCHPVGNCGELLEADAIVVYVDAHHLGVADGSSAKPWRRVGDAVDNAPALAVISIAAGIYEENVVLAGKPLVLRGACPAEVELRGLNGTAIVVEAGADGSKISHMAITGPGAGVRVDGATDIKLQSLWIHDTGAAGVLVGPESASGATIRSSLIERTVGAGVLFGGADELRIERCVIRDIGKRPSEPAVGVVALPSNVSTPGSLVVERSAIGPIDGLGIGVNCATAFVRSSLVRRAGHTDEDPTGSGGIITGSCDQDLQTTLAVKSSVIDNSIGVGIELRGAEGSIETTTIRGVTSNAARGHGVLVWRDAFYDVPSTLLLRRSIVEDTGGAAIVLDSGAFRGERIVIRKSHRDPGLFFGPGLLVRPSTADEPTNVVTMSGAVFDSNRTAGIVLFGADASLDHLLVENTERIEGVGWGVAALFHPTQQLPSQISLSDSTIRNNVALGIYIQGSHGSVSRSSITNTALADDGYLMGDGVVVAARIGVAEVARASLQLFESTVAGNGRSGVANFGADLIFGDNQITCNPIAINAVGELDGHHVSYTFDDRGGNHCGCDNQVAVCELEISSLKEIGWPDPAAP